MKTVVMFKFNKTLKAFICLQIDVFVCLSLFIDQKEKFQTNYIIEFKRENRVSYLTYLVSRLYRHFCNKKNYQRIFINIFITICFTFNS